MFPRPHRPPRAPSARPTLCQPGAFGGLLEPGGSREGAGAPLPPRTAGLQTKRGWDLGIAHQNKGPGSPGCTQWRRTGSFGSPRAGPRGKRVFRGTPAPKRLSAPLPPPHNGSVPAWETPPAFVSPQPEASAPLRRWQGGPGGAPTPGFGGLTADPALGTPLQTGGGEGAARPIHSPPSCGYGVPCEAVGGCAPPGAVGCRVRGPRVLGSPPDPPPISLGMEGHSSPANRCQATRRGGGVARRPVARRQAGTPPHPPSPTPIPGAGQGGGSAGRWGWGPPAAVLGRCGGTIPAAPQSLTPLCCAEGGQHTPSPCPPPSA